MWVSIVVAILNAAILFGSRMLRIPGLDLLPAGTILIAASGENVFFGSLLLVLPFFILSATAFGAGWVVLPVLFVVGLLASIGLHPLVSLVVYYAGTVLLGYFLGQLGPRYGMFLAVNGSLNAIVLYFAAKTLPI